MVHLINFISCVTILCSANQGYHSFPCQLPEEIVFTHCFLWSILSPLLLSLSVISLQRLPQVFICRENWFDELTIQFVKFYMQPLEGDSKYSAVISTSGRVTETTSYSHTVFTNGG